MSEFHVLYSSIEIMSTLSGLYRFKGWSGVSRRYRRLFVVYSILSTLPLIYFLVGNIHMYVVTFTFTVKTFHTREIGIIATSLLVLFESVYFIIRRDRVQSLMNTFQTVTKNLTENSPFKTNSESTIFYTAKKINLIIKYFCVLNSSLIVFYPLRYYVDHLLSGSTLLLFPDAIPGYSFRLQYEIILFLQFSMSFINSVKQISCCTFMFAMLVHTTHCLKQLRVISKSVFYYTDGSNKNVCRNREYRGGTVVRQWTYLGLLYGDSKMRFVNKNGCNNHTMNSSSASCVERFKEWINLYKGILQ